MATQPVVLNGTFTSENGSVMGVFNGTMTTSDSNGGGGGGEGIWGGGNEPFPTPPIANVPGAPGYRPPGDHIWGPTDPRPTPPIAFPPGWVGGVPPGGWPEPPDGPPTNPPDPNWVWGFTPRGGGMWVPVYVPEAGVDPSPKA